MFSGQNIDMMTQTIMEEAEKLQAAGMYKHTLTGDVVSNLLQAEAVTLGTLSFKLNVLKAKLDTEIRAIQYMSKIDADKHMAKK